MRTGSKFLVWLVCGLVTVSAAVAQDSSSPLKLSLTLRADYTDNRDSLDEPDDESTWDFYAKPRLDLFLDGERSFLDLSYAPSVRYRTEPSASQNEDELQHDLGISAEYDVSPTITVRASEKLDITDDPQIDDIGGMVRQDRSYLLNRTRAGINYQVTEATDMDVSGYYMDKNYDADDVAAESDENHTDVQLVTTTIMTPSVSVFWTARYMEFGFESAVGLVRDFNSILLGVGSEIAMADGLRSGVTLGWQSQDYDDAGIDGDDVPYVNLWLRGETIPSTRLIGEVTHGLRDADAYPYASQEYTDVRATAEWDASPRVTLSASGTYRRSDYSARPSFTPTTVDLPVDDGVEDRYIAQGSVAYHFSKTTSLTLTQRYEDLDSEVGESFVKNTTQLVFGREF